MKVKELLLQLVQQLKQILLTLQIERKEYIFTNNPHSPLLHIAGVIFQMEMLINELDDN
jgi:hypothetical protein